MDFVENSSNCEWTSFEHGQIFVWHDHYRPFISFQAKICERHEKFCFCNYPNECKLRWVEHDRSFNDLNSVKYYPRITHTLFTLNLLLCRPTMPKSTQMCSNCLSFEIGDRKCSCKRNFFVALKCFFFQICCRSFYGNMWKREDENAFLIYFIHINLSKMFFFFFLNVIIKFHIKLIRLCASFINLFHILCVAKLWSRLLSETFRLASFTSTPLLYSNVIIIITEQKSNTNQ